MTAGVERIPNRGARNRFHGSVIALADGRSLELGRRTRVMGIVNVTPDSFSDGGRWLDPAAAIEHGLALAGAGADLLDVGGESTRPGAAAVDTQEELRRVIPVIEALVARAGVPVSVDTRKPEVAGRALDAGAALLNDVSMLRTGTEMAELAARRGAPLILMHSRGTPETMTGLTDYPGGVVAGVRGELQEAVEKALDAGLSRERILLDPGIGFAKTHDQSLELLRSLRAAIPEGHAIVLGVSRKRFIGHVLDVPMEHRGTGTLAAEAAGVAAGADILRTHNAGACRQMAEMLHAIAGSPETQEPRP